jgi:hypothetical protein
MFFIRLSPLVRMYSTSWSANTGGAGAAEVLVYVECHDVAGLVRVVIRPASSVAVISLGAVAGPVAFRVSLVHLVAQGDGCGRQFPAHGVASGAAGGMKFVPSNV